jgi:hypothetical protein
MQYVTQGCIMVMLRQVLDQDYDWVFGSDVTYCEEMLTPLAKLMRQLVLTGETSSVIKLAHMHRNKDLDKSMREAFHGERTASAWILFDVHGSWVTMSKRSGADGARCRRQSDSGGCALGRGLSARTPKVHGTCGSGAQMLCAFASFIRLMSSALFLVLAQTYVAGKAVAAVQT